MKLKKWIIENASSPREKKAALIAAIDYLDEGVVEQWSAGCPRSHIDTASGLYEIMLGDNPSLIPVDCECMCGCCETATQYDDAGHPVCDKCAEAVFDEDGECHCNGPNGTRDVEIVTECCGAGGQTRQICQIAEEHD
jgi:hypothetical protein